MAQHRLRHLLRRAFTFHKSTAAFTAAQKPAPQTPEAENNMLSELLASITTDAFPHLSDADTITLFARAFPDDLERLKTASPAAESSAPQQHPTPSKLLFNTDYDEVNRTLAGVLSLKYILSNNHRAFIESQSFLPLTPSSFATLRTLFLSTLKTPLDTLTLLVSIIINDLGKCPSLLPEHIKPENANHDTILYTAAVHNLLPSLSLLRRLSPPHADLLTLGLQVSTTLNIAQLAQAENVPGSLSAITALRGHPHAFSLKFLELFLDVAGAGAHVDCRGARTMIQPVCESFLAAREVLGRVIAGGGLRENYDLLLERRAEMLAEKGFKRLDVREEEERGLLRLCAMGRVGSVEMAGVFGEAFEGLEGKKKGWLVGGLGVDGIGGGGRAVVPYYMPALFVEGLRGVEGEKRVGVVRALMGFLGRVYEVNRMDEGEGVVERDVIWAKDVVAGEEFKKDPSVLDRVEVKAE